jgi:hypothetical protein
MPVSLEFLRGMLGILAIFFAHMAGRSAALVRKRQQKVSRLYAWVLRTLVCALVLIFRHPVDTVAIGVWVIALAAFGLGMSAVLRQKPPEDLTDQIFPE